MNEGRIDRILRAAVVAPLLLFIGGYFFDGAVTAVFFVLAIVMLITGFVGFCPLYRVFGINTCPRTHA